MKFLPFTVLLLLAMPAFAQTSKQPTFEDLQREMEAMQHRLFERLQLDGPADSTFALPEWKWDTTFSFRFDSLPGGQGGGQFFFSPFGPDTTFLQDFFGSNPFGQGFKPFEDGFQWIFPEDENSALQDR